MLVLYEIDHPHLSPPPRDYLFLVMPESSSQGLAPKGSERSGDPLLEVVSHTICGQGGGERTLEPVNDFLRLGCIGFTFFSLLRCFLSRLAIYWVVANKKGMTDYLIGIA